LPSLIIQNVRVSNKQIEADAVTSDKIKDSEIKTADLADSIVTTPKVVDSAVTTAKLADSAVTTAKIADSQVTTPKLADSIVTSSKISAKAFQAEEGPCDSVETWITFPQAFDTTPYVVANPTTGASWVRVTQRTAGSFATIADAAGSIEWIAWVR